MRVACQAAHAEEGRKPASRNLPPSVLGHAAEVEEARKIVLWHTPLDYGALGYGGVRTVLTAVKNAGSVDTDGRISISTLPSWPISQDAMP